MKVLITGASGFLGKRCVQLLRLQNYRVITTDIIGEVDLIGDLSDKSFVNSLPEVDIIVNCAAVQYVTKNLPFFRRTKFFQINNVNSAKNLLNRYKKSTNTHFIHIGTSMMYKQTGQELYCISDLKHGSGVYSKTKIEAQAFIDQLPNISTIIPCIIGGEGREGLFIGFVKMIDKYSSVIYPGKGNHKISMVHIDDVVSLIVKIIETKSFGIFNAASKEPLSISEWVDAISEELNIETVRKVTFPLAPLAFLSKIFGYRILAKEQLLMLKYQHVLDIRKSLETGWQPKFTNKEIVKNITRGLINE